MSATLDKAFVCFRIGTPQSLSDERFADLLRLFEKYKGVTDEITFFTSETHPPLPLETIRERAEVLARRMTAARELGYRAGINVLSTLGHHNENLPNSLTGDYTRMTDLDGSVCAGSFCPNDEHFRCYITRLYQLVVSANPDYIWVDDDVRLFGHMPIQCGCFCDTCLAVFEKECGVRYTRESLRTAFDTGPMPAKLEVRRAWLRHNRATIKALFTIIEKTVHDLKPGLPLGFMTGDRFFEGYDFDTWAATLAGPNKAEVLWRPGGGNYTDEWLDGIAQKAHQMGRQTALLPPSVVCIESEIESFPYQRLKKSAHVTALEACSYVAGGCTGAAFNVLSMYAEPLDEYEPLVARLNENRPFLDKLVRSFGRSRPIGVYSGWVKDSFAARNPDGPWFAAAGDPGTHHVDELLVTGIPPAYEPEHSRVAALSGDSVVALTDAEIRTILSLGVYMDPQALGRLNDLGYQEFTGFVAEGGIADDCIEQFTEHPLNGALSGRKRDGRQSFWKNTAFPLKPVGKGAAGNGAQSLARIVNYTPQEIASCCMGVFENALGGRICVGAYYPWVQLQSSSKAAQMKAVVRWLSKDTLPGYVASFHRANIWIREPEPGRYAIALTNASLDTAQDVTLALLTPKDKITVTDMQCRETTVTANSADGPYTRFTLPPMQPWHMCLITA